MGPLDALTAIIARCPDLLREATDALRAVRAGSPIADRRVAHVVESALAQYGEAFSPEERAELVAVAAPAADDEDAARSARLVVRLAPDELARVHADAAAAGRTASDHARERLGLPTRAGGDHA